MPDLFDPSPIIEVAPWAKHRIHLILSAATWPLASGVIIANAAHCAGFGSEHATSLAALWLIALGAIGCPVYGLRLFGRRLTLRVSLLTATACASIAVLLTALFAFNVLAASIPIQLLALVVPMAIAVQSFNAAESRAARLREIHAAEAEADRRVAAALESPCPRCQLREQIEKESAKLRLIARFRNLSPEEAAELVDVALAVAHHEGQDGGPSRV